MYSLFWNIFLSFWTAIIVVGLAIAWYTEKLSEDEVPPLFTKQHKIFTDQSESAKHILESLGVSALLKWKTESNNSDAIGDIFVVDENGLELSQQVLPPDVKRFIRSGFNIHFNMPFNATQDSILGYSVYTPDNSHYFLVTTFYEPHPLLYLLTPQRLIIGLIVSGLICFALAQYLVLPIKKLSRAVLQLSLGNLNTRISGSIQNRNDEIGQLALDFNHMAKRLQTIMDSQKQLMRDISHELRSPLARMQVAIELVRKKSVAKIEPDLQRIECDIDKLDIMVEELLTFAGMEVRDGQIERTRINIIEMIENIVADARFEHCLPERKRNILTDCPSHLEIWGNLPLLHRALENIIRNACFYSPESGKVRIKCRSSKDDGLLITVQDQGPGVPEDMLEKIFEPFTRVCQSRGAQSGGYGIGLAISKRAIEIHGGRITAANLPSNDGFLISITLPIAEPKPTNTLQMNACGIEQAVYK